MLLKLTNLLLFISCLSIAQANEIEWKEILNEDNIKVYQAIGEFDILPFKAETVLNESKESILKVLKDMKNKSKWSPKLDYVKVHKKISENEIIFSEFYKTPWPSTDREFLLIGKETHLSPKKIKITAKSLNDPSLMNEDYIQADVIKLDLLLTELSKDKTKIEFEFYGDLKGWLPIWLVNLIQKKWPMRFLQGLRNETALYTLQARNN
ncbi:START domain-containing protein [Bacteriovoracaceae bacterium]|nr:START domain-containing protein [Bacteriovoracaceae bacterium]